MKRVYIKDNDLYATERSQGLSGEMLNMRGKAFDTSQIETASVLVKENEFNSWWFDKLDVIFLDDKNHEERVLNGEIDTDPPINPVFFDPLNLEL